MPPPHWYVFVLSASAMLVTVVGHYFDTGKWIDPRPMSLFTYACFAVGLPVLFFSARRNDRKKHGVAEARRRSG
jgi:hypothetical protein